MVYSSYTIDHEFRPRLLSFEYRSKIFFFRFVRVFKTCCWDSINLICSKSTWFLLLLVVSSWVIYFVLFNRIFDLLTSLLFTSRLSEFRSNFVRIFDFQKLVVWLQSTWLGVNPIAFQYLLLYGVKQFISSYSIEFSISNSSFESFVRILRQVFWFPFVK